MLVRQKRDHSDSDLDYNEAELLRTPKRSKNIFDRRTTYGLGNATHADLHPRSSLYDVDPWSPPGTSLDRQSATYGNAGNGRSATLPGPDNMWRTIPEDDAGWQAEPNTSLPEEATAPSESTQYTVQTSATIPPTAPSVGDSDGDVEQVLQGNITQQTEPSEGYSSHIHPGRRTSPARFHAGMALKDTPNVLGLSVPENLPHLPRSPITPTDDVNNALISHSVSTAGLSTSISEAEHNLLQTQSTQLRTSIIETRLHTSSHLLDPALASMHKLVQTICPHY
ncbi:hypothetical protein AURDEDRAFT_161662 [Auricularia subglabra TFB-10046 SS5]|nr:hypothetical protein AURDEDRAFT_161662 [Auricularia subglabra TFB-10046 SS5]